MENPPDDKELNELSDIYSILKGDAREIVHDLQKGIVMWREAAGANITAAGFLLILALKSYRSFSIGLIDAIITLNYLSGLNRS